MLRTISGSFGRKSTGVREPLPSHRTNGVVHVECAVHVTLFVKAGVHLDSPAATLAFLWELLLCPQNVKLPRITWINNIGGQIYGAVPIKGVSQDWCPLRQWQRHIGAFQQYKGAIRWTAACRKC